VLGMVGSRGCGAVGVILSRRWQWAAPAGARFLHPTSLQTPFSAKERLMRVLGILLVAFGVALLIWGGLTLFIPSEVVDLGALSITIRDNLVIPLPPIAGLICLIVGALMILSVPAAPPY